MNRIARITFIHACGLLLLALGMAAVGTARAEEGASANPAGELQQLDEIWVHGKSLARRIEDAEDKLFRRYNKLNRNNEYDVLCGTVALQPGSMIMTRVCRPAFVAYYTPASNAGWVAAYRNVSYSTGTTYCAGVSPMAAMQETNGDMYWIATGCPDTHQYSLPPSLIRPVAAPPAVATEKRGQYLKNFVKVMVGDTRMMEAAADLEKLYDEMDEVQANYRAAMAEAQARRKQQRESLKPVTGPRG